MRLPFLLLAVLALALPSCATKPKGPKFSAPQSAAGGKAIYDTAGSNTTAKTKAAALKRSVAPEGLKLWNALTAALEEANLKAALASKELTGYAAKVADQTKLLVSASEDKNKAIEAANYWQAKHGKALREIWIWRSLAFVVVISALGFVVAKLGFRFF
jgi:hypothetical protein